MKIQSKRSYLIGALAVGISSVVTLTAGPLKAADDASDSSSVAGDVDEASEQPLVDYRAPGVSFQQFGSAAKQLIEDDEALSAERAQWVFTRAFAWAAYEYTYNRPNYDRWVAQLSDANLQEIMQVSVAHYVAAGRPPVGNPLHAAAHARTSWISYVQSTMVDAQ